MKQIFTILVLSFTIANCSFAQSDGSLTVDGEVKKPLKLTLASMVKYPVAEVKAKDRDGKEHTFKGTPLSTVLDSAGVTLGKELRGENLVKYVLLKAVDGYEVIYSLAEIDPQFTSNNVILATHVDDNPLPKGEGPFRIVAPNDKRPARWIRELNSIKVVSSKD